MRKKCYSFTYHFKFQTKVTHMIFTCEISTISWIAFRTVTSEWQGERPRGGSCQNSDISAHESSPVVTRCLVSGDGVTSVSVSDTQSPDKHEEPSHSHRTVTGERRARGIIWYHRNMETRLTRGRSQDSGMCRTFGSIFTNNCRFLISQGWFLSFL